MLRKCLRDDTQAIECQTMEMRPDITNVEVPERIIDRMIKHLRHKDITLVKVQWSHHGADEATWELESEMKENYPHLFDEVRGANLFLSSSSFPFRAFTASSAFVCFYALINNSTMLVGGSLDKANKNLEIWSPPMKAIKATLSSTSFTCNISVLNRVMYSQIDSPFCCFTVNKAHSATFTFTFTNSCPYTIWPRTLTGGGGAQLSSTGFELASKASSSLNMPAPWIGRFWAWTFCATDASGKFSCQTADCASGQIGCNGASAIPPATLVELALVANNGQDFYDVSLIDGFSLPVSIIPQGGSGSCSPSSCPADVNAECPADLAVKNSDGATISCKTACLAFDQPRYCCTGAYNTEATCPPTNYSQYFEKKCPLASSNAYGVTTSTFTCNGRPTKAITFCP
ncbi:thaumatin-like protein 1b [Cornus florida]|uniref:thaumatin-like protein 1b n=1 Tax=Cornus florida TaxID=4283 RepID=UPI00289A5B41|nr:thaumatin-like protein 1b [Cornus florida]